MSSRMAGLAVAMAAALCGAPAVALASPCGVPAGQGAAAAASPFGVGPSYVNARSAADLARWMPAMTAIGVTTLRTTDAYWHDVEPRPGQWNWRAVDDAAAWLAGHGVAFGLLLFGSPGWNALDKPGTLPVNNLAAWSTYVTQLALRMRGKVQCFEVWNEPPNATGATQTPDDYAKIVQAAYRAIKAVDPQMRVGLAAKSAHVNYLELVIRAGARDHFDYVTLHPYEVLDQVAASSHPDAEAVYLNVVPALRRMLAAANPQRQDVPVAFSELGITAAKGTGVQASGLVKAYAMGIAQGVANIQWFEGRDGDSGPLGLLDAQGRQRPAYRALATLIEHIGRQPAYLGWVLLGGRHPAFVFDGPRGPVAVAWTAAPTEREALTFPSPVTVVDPPTASASPTRTPVITRDPLLLADLPASVLAKAAANRGKPFRGEADYAASAELFVDYEKGTASGGLSTLAEAAVAESVRTYGGSARAGNVPGGHLFVVHPSFLAGGHQPLEITVEVRRTSPQVAAGFNLKYEALTPTGFKTAAGGWTTVPAGSGWFTKTWRIADPSFVWKWGHNFVLDSDGVHDQYAIRSIRVRKVGPAGR